MEVELLIRSVRLKGDLEIPVGARGLIIFACRGGTDRKSPRNNIVAKRLNSEGFGTLLFDLLTEEEDEIYKNRFEIELLTERLIGVTRWCMENEETSGLIIGYFGASSGSAAALSAAAYWGTKIKAVVSRRGRPDLAMEVLDLIEAPTLLVVDGEDRKDIDLNKKAYLKLGCGKKTEIVAGATHLPEENGVLEKVAKLASVWFLKHM